MKKKRNIIIGSLLVAIVAMSVGYAALAQQLNILGQANVNASWDLEFTDINEGEMKNASTVGQISMSGTSISFEVDLSNPGASATYDIVVENKGTIDATLESITGVDAANATDPVDIQYSVTGIEEGEDLLSGAKTTFHVTVSWDADSTEIPEVTSKTATITLNYVQKTL